MAISTKGAGGLILVIWSCSKVHSANFLVIKTHLFRHFYLAVDFLGLRRSGPVCSFKAYPNNWRRPSPATAAGFSRPPFLAIVGAAV